MSNSTGPKAKIEVVVTENLRRRVLELKELHDVSWRELAQRIDGWQWSHAMLHKIAQEGGQEFVNLAVYEVLEVAPPVIPITLENVDAMQISMEALARFLDRAQLLECAVEGCMECFYRIGNAKYCHLHSWATREGRRYWRARKRKKKEKQKR
ncbi:MAG: hypothetical protein D6814_00780 [Calditrichaeota bacterium]|nr:MAG: hypothetical protein D6814_00780 [Calditrichota bacterium]